MKKIIFVLMLIFNTYASGENLYELKSHWLNVNKEKVTEAVGQGSYVVMAMIYTHCAHACPMTISKLEKIEKEFNKAGLSNVKFVLASFDFKADRPEKLAQYAKDRNLAADKWIFLAAESEKDARDLSVVLGISYKDIGDGDFSHSNVLTLLNPEGKILAKIDNLNAKTESFIDAYLDDKKSKGVKCH